MIRAECAFHEQQLITNFCACKACLLPVCPSCIKLHAEQHRINGTTARFQQIQKVYEQVRSQQINIQTKIAQITQQLLQVQRTRKQNEILVRKKFVQFRNKLIKQIDRYIIELQQKIMNKMIKQDQRFIANLQQLDDDTFQKLKQIEIERQQLNGKQFLKTIICHHKQNRKQAHQRDIQKLKKMTHQLGKRTIYISFEENCLSQIQSILKNTIIVEHVLQGK